MLDDPFNSEEKKLNDLKRGDVTTYSQLYTTYYNKLCRYVYSMSDDTGVAEDITQEILTELWENRTHLKIHTSLNAYLYRCTRNRFLAHNKKERRNSSLVEHLRTEAAIEIELEASELREKRLRAIEIIIENLPRKRKEIFVLNKFQNYKYREIAEMRNISERTVESQIRKALITIREKVKELKFGEGLLGLVGVLFSW